MDSSRGPVVSNTTPLITLAGLDRLDLLSQLYGEIWIPEAVLWEYQQGLKPGDPDLEGQTWVTIARNPIPHPTLPARLDAGEMAAIALALQIGARVILLDEAYGRRIAQERGLLTSGTLGILLAAKEADYLPSVTGALDAMIAQGRYIGRALRDRVLREAGELTESAR